MAQHHAAERPGEVADGEDGERTLLASLGGGLEYYDFIVYGIFAQYIAAAFFPASENTVTTNTVLRP
jgi:hypothetical protein